MEAILVFDFNNYLIYNKHNRSFLSEIADIVKSYKLVNQECKSKIISSLQTNKEEFHNLITLIFGPYVASKRFLEDECPKVDLFEDKKIQIISHSYLDYMFLLVFQSNNDRTFNEANRKLDTFVDLTKLFYGVSINELENDQNNNARNFLEFNLKCWQQEKDQPLFKLNAIERLIINDQIKNELERMQLFLIEQITDEPLLKEIPFQSMIFVNDMLICDYKRPNSPKILHSDLILLTLMVKTYFCCLSDLEDKTLISSDSDYIASDDEDLCFCDHPNCEIRTNKKTNDLEPDFRDPLKLNDQKSNKSKSILSHLAESDRYLFDDCEYQLVFFHSYIDRTNLIPFLVRFIRINNEIVFLTLSELPSTFLYYYTNKLLLFFNGLQYSNQKYYGFSALNQLESSIKKMQTCLDYIMNEKQCNGKNINQNAKLLKQKLDKFSKSDYRKYILAHKNFQLSSYLEALTSSICIQLKELVNTMIFDHHHNQLDLFHSVTINKLGKLKKIFLYQLRDYLNYIWVKSNHNVAIEPYQNLIPNLVFFIYVDRNKNEFITSDQNFNLNCCLTRREMNDTNCFYEHKSMVYNLIDKSYHLLKTNQSMQSRWHEKNLIFNYAMWFEDHTGKLLNCFDKQFNLKSLPNLTSKSNFIEEIVAQCFPAFKLVTNRDREFYTSLTSSTSSSTDYSILRCYEIFFVQIKNPNQKIHNLDKLSNEERFLVGKNSSNNFDLLKARRLGKKIAQTNSLNSKK